MMKELIANRDSWNLLAKDHYENFKQKLSLRKSLLNPVIEQELGDITGKTLMHLQCNTGADTLSLARLGAKVSGVDLAPDNVKYAQKMFKDFGTEGHFYESNVLTFSETHHQKYDIVFTSEGAIIWLPDFKAWAKTVRRLMKEDGVFYVNEMHPTFLMLDEEALPKGEIKLKYPYFNREVAAEDSIGGYAAEPRKGETYSWMYSISDVVNALIEAGLQIEFIHEFDDLCYNLGGMIQNPKTGQFFYPNLLGKFPFMFSIKATVRK